MVDETILKSRNFIQLAVNVSVLGGLDKEVAIAFATTKTGPELEQDADLMAALDANLTELSYRRGKVFGIKADGETNTPRVSGKGTVFANRI
jgi:hypothetical protein